MRQTKRYAITLHDMRETNKEICNNTIGYETNKDICNNTT